MSDRAQGQTAPTGRRLLRTAGRVALWALVALIFVRGIASIAAEPHDHAPAPAPTREVFPSEEARALAVRFARAYLSGRSADLRRFLAASMPRDLVVDIPRGSAVATIGVAAETALSSDRALITVTCELGERRAARYLSVPVARDAAGGLAVYALPAFVAGPRPARIDVEEPAPLAGAEAAAIRTLADRFLAAYVSGDGDLTYLAAPGAGIDPLAPGLRLADVDAVGQLRATASQRTVLVEATLQDTAAGTRYGVAYRLELVRRERWYVARVAGAPS
jgi:hypothetical protein